MPSRSSFNSWSLEMISKSSKLARMVSLTLREDGYSARIVRKGSGKNSRFFVYKKPLRYY